MVTLSYLWEFINPDKTTEQLKETMKKMKALHPDFNIELLKFIIANRAELDKRDAKNIFTQLSEIISAMDNIHTTSDEALFASIVTPKSYFHSL